MKTLLLTRNQRSKSDIESALEDGDMGFSRPVQLVKWLSDDRTTVAIDEFLESTSCDPVRFDDALGVAGRLHDGILQEWRPISDQVQRQIQLFVRDNPAGLVTMGGYGPAGALASVNAIYTQTQLFLGDRLRLLTFGGIRFTTRQMRKAVRTLLNGNAFDFMTGADPIYGRKRYSTMGSTYFRIGQLIHIRPDDEYRAYDQYWGTWERMRHRSEPDQYSLEHYQIEVEAWNGDVIRISKKSQ